MKPATPSAEEVARVADFRAALRRFLRQSERIARASRLTPQRHLLLLMIKGAPGEHSTATELAERLQLAQSTVTELVRRAESAGLIEREQSQRDARVAHLRLTSEGDRRLMISSLLPIGVNETSMPSRWRKSPTRSPAS